MPLCLVDRMRVGGRALQEQENVRYAFKLVNQSRMSLFSRWRLDPDHSVESPAPLACVTPRLLPDSISRSRDFNVSQQDRRCNHLHFGEFVSSLNNHIQLTASFPSLNYPSIHYRKRGRRGGGERERRKRERESEVSE